MNVLFKNPVQNVSMATTKTIVGRSNVSRTSTNQPFDCNSAGGSRCERHLAILKQPSNTLWYLALALLEELTGVDAFVGVDQLHTRLPFK